MPQSIIGEYVDWSARQQASLKNSATTFCIRRPCGGPPARAAVIIDTCGRHAWLPVGGHVPIISDYQQMAAVHEQPDISSPYLPPNTIALF